MSNDAIDLYALAGGEAGIRAVMTDFYDAVFADVMIGFFFRHADKQRLIDKETEFSARMLGGDVEYTGMSLPKAHGKHPIMGGHFMRRLQLLKEAMDKHDLPQPVRDAWVQHTHELRRQVTPYEGGGCD